MKNKLFLIPVFLFAALLVVGAKIVLAQTAGLPRVTTACETKIGGVLMGIGDGFSSLKTCPGNSRKVVLGEVGTGTGGGGSVIGPGDIAFITDDGFALTKGGVIWKYGYWGGVVKWTSDNNKLPEGVSVDEILQWTKNSFLTKSGDFWVYTYDAYDVYFWSKAGAVVEN
jgi:hypothetical protein